MARKKEQKDSIEELFGQLDELLKNMDEENVSLEQSFSLYQQGVQLIKMCNEKIDQVEKQFLILDGTQMEMEKENEFSDGV